jgi:phosphoinositide-3-kinase regulatory subunit 4
MFSVLFHSLGSTRFFKVARAKSQEGMIVVKVFALHDPMLPLVKHRVHIEEIKSKLQSAVNCLCFQKVIVCLLNLKGIVIDNFVSLVKFLYR